MMERFEIKGSNADYIMTEDIFRKIENGQVKDFDRKTKQWIRVNELSMDI